MRRRDADGRRHAGRGQDLGREFAWGTTCTLASAVEDAAGALGLECVATYSEPDEVSGFVLGVSFGAKVRTPDEEVEAAKAKVVEALAGINAAFGPPMAAKLEQDVQFRPEHVQYEEVIWISV